VRLRSRLVLCVAGCAASSCAGQGTVMVGPYLCDEWTVEAAADYERLPADDLGYLDDLVASWNMTCSKNHGLLGKEWPRPKPKPLSRWWEVWR